MVSIALVRDYYSDLIYKLLYFQKNTSFGAVYIIIKILLNLIFPQIKPELASRYPIIMVFCLKEWIKGCGHNVVSTGWNYMPYGYCKHSSKFGDKVISRDWSSRPCVLIPRDYLLWDRVHLLIFANKLAAIIHDIRSAILEKVAQTSGMPRWSCSKSF